MQENVQPDPIEVLTIVKADTNNDSLSNNVRFLYEIWQNNIFLVWWYNVFSILNLSTLAWIIPLFWSGNTLLQSILCFRTLGVHWGAQWLTGENIKGPIEYELHFNSLFQITSSIWAQNIKGSDRAIYKSHLKIQKGSPFEKSLQDADGEMLGHIFLFLLLESICRERDEKFEAPYFFYYT